MLRRINLSAAVIVLVCFFLPWIQVGCGKASEAVSGLRVARETDHLLWLVPLLMLAVLIAGLLRAWKDQPKFAAVIGIISGGVTALLLNRERLKLDDNGGLIPIQFTGWFWLALISAVVIVTTAMGLLVRRRQPD